MKQIIKMVEKCERDAIEKIEDAKIKYKKKIDTEKSKSEKLIQDKKTQNINSYKTEIENFNLQLNSKKKDFKDSIETEYLKYEKNFKLNSKMAVCSVIDEILNLVDL